MHFGGKGNWLWINTSIYPSFHWIVPGALAIRPRGCLTFFAVRPAEMPTEG